MFTLSSILHDINTKISILQTCKLFSFILICSTHLQNVKKKLYNSQCLKTSPLHSNFVEMTDEVQDHLKFYTGIKASGGSLPSLY